MRGVSATESFPKLSKLILSRFIYLEIEILCGSDSESSASHKADVNRASKERWTALRWAGKGRSKLGTMSSLGTLRIAHPVAGSSMGPLGVSLLRDEQNR